MGIFFNPELARNAEAPAVEAVLLLQRQLQAAAQLQHDHAPVMQPRHEALIPLSGRTTQSTLPLQL